MTAEAFARLDLASDDPDRTVGELQRMLGRFGFQWLCACAVYPGLRFPLSVYLGRCLAEAVGRPPPDENEHLALFRLPWFRLGWMPEELRLTLIGGLEPELRPLVRTAIEVLLFNALDDDRRDPDAAPQLDFARPPRGWRSALRAWMEGSPPGTLARDTIFVEYMMGRVPKPADLRLNRRLARLFGAKLAGWFDRRTLGYIVLAVGASAAVWSSADILIRPLFSRTVTTPVTAPAMVALETMALPHGRLLMPSPESEANTARLQEAVQAYRAALEEQTRERAPLQWATVQMKLGGALVRLGEREANTARLQEAVQAYRAALEEVTRARVPLQWATVQMNLGNALMKLGERESGTARLEEAVAAYRAALEEWTRERAPLQWATVQNNLGGALATLGERTGQLHLLKEALDAITAAREVYRDAGMDQYEAYFANGIGALKTVIALLERR